MKALGQWSSGAVLSDDKRYRYRLWRRWNNDCGPVCWVMLNPSTADHQTDDATIRRCIGFSRMWGYGGIEVVNLFAFRTTYPDELLAAEDPVGSHNNQWILKTADESALVVAAWGIHGHYQLRSFRVRSWLSPYLVMCLGKCSNGEPRHPVRLPYSVELERLEGLGAIDKGGNREQTRHA